MGRSARCAPPPPRHRTLPRGRDVEGMGHQDQDGGYGGEAAGRGREDDGRLLHRHGEGGDARERVRAGRGELHQECVR